MKNEDHDKYDFDVQFQMAKNKMGKVNIVVAGKTGVGKSALVMGFCFAEKTTRRLITY